LQQEEHACPHLQRESFAIGERGLTATRSETPSIDNGDGFAMAPPQIDRHNSATPLPGQRHFALVSVRGGRPPASASPVGCNRVHTPSAHR
jgi:hypothetical protein